MGGGRGGPPEGGDREAMRRRFDELQAGLESLDITQGESQLTLSYADGRLREIPIGPVDRESDVLEGAEWKGGRLVVKGTPFGERKVKETYQLTAEGRQLRITTKLYGDGRMPTVNYTRVYDIADQAETAADSGE